MPRTGSSPMNLTLMMTSTQTASSPEAGAVEEIAIVMFPGEKAHAPSDGGTWVKVDSFTPDPTATYTIVPGEGNGWPVHSEGVAVYKKTS